LTRIGHSLWGDFDKALLINEDTLSGLSLLQLDSQQTLERASKILIERAEKNPPRALSLQHPFYRLAPIERFLITSLHVEHWSYSRIARVLGIEPSLISTWAWSIRMKFCFQEAPQGLDYPRGPSHLGATCPEYNSSSPWTQRLLDDEMNNKERSFLQMHLMGCENCRRSLELTRKLIFKIDSLIPVKNASAEVETMSEKLYASWENDEIALHPAKTTFQRSLLALIIQPRVQVALMILIAVSYSLIKKSI
jgi:hypothetical protein